MSDFAEICERAARVGGEVLLDWQGRFAVREKGPSDLVTEADFASQEAIREILLAAFPEHDFLGEEEPRELVAHDRYRWIVDPLDGTLNYVHGLRNYSVSVALEHRGQILVGTVFDPNANECFTAIADRGAFLNGARLSVSRAESLREALVAASFPPRVARDGIEVANFVEVLVACQAIRRMGSAALNLCYVAAGRLDAYFATETKAWDIAAGMLLVREAGGIFTDLHGHEVDLNRPRFVAAATARLHGEICQRLRDPVEAQRP